MQSVAYAPSLLLSKIVFSTIAGLRASSIIAIALLLLFGVLTVISPTINTVIAAPDNNTSPANIPNSLVNNNNIDKQTVGSQENDNSKNDGRTTTSSKPGSSVDPTTLPFPIPTDHSKKIKTNPDSSSHENDRHNSHQNNDNNHNKDSKGKVKTTTTPLRLPFP